MKANVLVVEPAVQSRAALLLLHKRLLRSAVYYGYQGWLRFRIETLERWLAERGDLVCAYCGKTGLQIEADNKDSLCATLDHVIPRSKGGAVMDLNNLVVACSPCNGKKGDKLLPTN